MIALWGYILYTTSMHIAVPHKLTKDKALARVKQTLGQHRAQILAHAKVSDERWEDSTLHFAAELQGKSISGTLAVTDTEYVLDAKLPLLWRMFEGRIEAEVAKQVQGMM